MDAGAGGSFAFESHPSDDCAKPGTSIPSQPISPKNRQFNAVMATNLTHRVLYDKARSQTVGKSGEFPEIHFFVRPNISLLTFRPFFP